MSSQSPIAISLGSSKEDHDNSNLILKKSEQMVNNISSFFQSKLAHLLNQGFNKNYKIGKHPITEVNVNNVEQMKNAVKN
ncbi:MAG: hypothetical protein sL5_07780 [Candidatus Mesenet longicola]|uniref:Uncharacterized protein n=1 Tax=Candidatus Mesenet longicola TaxID=1892558 RepID=A0A8J3HVP4_9RICK|nr:MAG: hypothetical protein sGL2_08350 [Candidatus Mesenet longicola]GHM59785.1 MAG: hypothetical protein sL5_07780 [Candidatus Mesenet longicola]